MKKRLTHRRFLPKMLLLGPLMGGVCFLLIGAVLHAMLTHDRTEAVTHRLLIEKGGALLSTLESGLRSGKRGNTVQRQNFLLEEIANRPDVLFVAIVGPDGIILSHSNPDRLGELLEFEGHEITSEEWTKLETGKAPRWALGRMEGQSAFMLYKQVGQVLVPSSRGKMHQTGHMPAVLNIPVTLFIGLDPMPLYAAQEEDRQRNLMFITGLLATGLLALVSLHLAARVRSSRQSQQTAEALTEKMMLSLPDGLILFDAQGNISHLNATASQWLGKNRPLLGRKATEVLPGELAALAARLLREPSLPDTETELLVGDTPVPLSVRGGPVETEEGGRVGSLLLMRDLSERKRLEAEIRRREKLAAVGNLAAGVAHEIRNPLSSIKGYATYFGERFDEGSEDREAARVMVGEVERLNRVITDLIELARPPALSCRPTNITALAADTLRLIRQDAASRDVAIHFKVKAKTGEVFEASSLDPLPDAPPPTLPLVDVDPDRLRQALLNLCLNALDAMPGGGDLKLSITIDEPSILIETADTGTGILADVLPTIFDPYFTTKGHGTGLGLATVHKIVEAHKGHVLAASQPGQTVFTIRLPLNNEETS